MASSFADSLMASGGMDLGNYGMTVKFYQILNLSGGTNQKKNLTYILDMAEYFQNSGHLLTLSNFSSLVALFKKKLYWRDYEKIAF